MMKNISLHIPFILLLTGLLTSCVDMNPYPAFSDHPGKVVIEARVTNESNRQRVIISRMIGGSDSAVFIPVTHAQVTISDLNGSSEELQMQEPGYYYTRHLKGIPSHTYYLEVWVNDTLYEAEDTMVPSMPIDSFHYEYYSNHSFLEAGYYLTGYMPSHPDQTAYYRASISVNDSLFNDYTDQILFDNGYTSDYMELFLPVPFQQRDTLTIKTYSLSQAAYDYFYQRISLTNDSWNYLQAVPRNPVNNLSNGALGFFQVSDVNVVEVIIE